MRRTTFPDAAKKAELHARQRQAATAPHGEGFVTMSETWPGKGTRRSSLTSGFSRCLRGAGIWSRDAQAGPTNVSTRPLFFDETHPA
jgi:hypothetical protein